MELSGNNLIIARLDMSYYFKRNQVFKKNQVLDLSKLNFTHEKMIILLHLIKFALGEES